MPAMPWTTVTDSRGPRRPPPAHPQWCREYATPAMPWTTVTDSGRPQGPLRANPLTVSGICHACYGLDHRHG
eukprot:8570921-Pyramimonas_sp.AAC.1